MRNRTRWLGLLLVLIGASCGPPTAARAPFVGKLAVIAIPRDKTVFPAGESIVHVLATGAEEGYSWWGEVTSRDWGCPRWSPNGSQLAITNHPGPTPTDPGFLYLVRADGRNLTYLADVDSCATWSPDGTHLTFFFESTLYIMDINTLEKTALVEQLDFGRSPADLDYAPDGTRIVCSAEKEIFQVQIAGAEITRLTPPCDECVFLNPRYSPNGEWLLYRWHDFRDPVAIYRMKADGSQVQRLRTGGNADWSPDSSQIAFISFDDHSIWVMNPDGSGARPLLRSPKWEYYTLDWGP